jgi:pyruvate dehydrogenase E2 component (dihydrolipoamide acetyltransferase)
MATRVLMPKGSDTMTEGKVLRWVKHEGDAVSNGDVVVEIETDKVDMEVESVGEGVLRKTLVKEGEVVPVGHLLGVIAAAEEDIAGLLERSTSADSVAVATEPFPPPPTQEDRVPATLDQGLPTPTSALYRTPQPEPLPVALGGRILASPLARRMAREKGIYLSRVSGSGPGGRIIRQDIDRATPFPAASPPPAPVPAIAPGLSPLPPPPAPSGPDFRDEPLSSMRKTIATRLAQSLGPVPHFYLTIEVDMKRAKELRESANNLDPNLKLSYNDIILKACAAALRLHREVNASFQGDKIRVFNRVHLGMAVAVEGGGLITPVIRDADTKTLQQISREARELAARARNRKLQPDEYTGGTFSVSNLGMMGIEEFSAVINPPEGAILAVGAVVEKPVVADHRIEIGYRSRMTLSCDHRVVDGSTGAKFLQTLQGILENPVYLAF